MRLQKRYLLGLLFFTVPLSAMFGQKLPVLRASRTAVDIRDGHNFRKGLWTISPDVKLDVYDAQRCRDAKNVTFYTDVDSLSFKVSPGNTYDFVIVLRGKDSAFTRISTIKQSYRKPTQLTPVTCDTIPFRLSANNGVMITGFLNESDSLSLLFDTGADNIVLFPSGEKKRARLRYDQQINTMGIGGASTRPLSKENRLRIGALQWDHESVMYNDDFYASIDGLIGYNVFEDKVVEVDYDRSILIIHDTSYTPAAGYRKLAMEFRGTMPFIQVRVRGDDNYYDGSFAMDIGFNGSFSIGGAFADKYSLRDQVRKIGRGAMVGTGPDAIDVDIVKIPGLELAGFEAAEVTAELQHGGHDEGGILGNDFLKRFNLVIDYQANEVWLKPNHLFHTPYLIEEKSKAALYSFIGSTLLITVVLLYLFLRWVRSKKARKLSEANAVP